MTKKLRQISRHNQTEEMWVCGKTSDIFRRFPGLNLGPGSFPGQSKWIKLHKNEAVLSV